MRRTLFLRRSKKGAGMGRLTCAADFSSAVFRRRPLLQNNDLTAFLFGAPAWRELLTCFRFCSRKSSADLSRFLFSKAFFSIATYEIC
jgi:hypothetical protein